MRKDKRLTQEQLGSLVDLSATQIGKYERGENRMSATRFEQLLSVLGTEQPARPGFAEAQRAYHVPKFDLDGLARSLKTIRREVDRCLKIMADASA
ncbi:helix-turn-helix domain-containing protein [Mesorhizobium sp. ASY16-5R]|uniref:helix-turn-helix domain-containing protein n=1 Tax=Mesorhizobium sp. ASY16-5R TaxID=3445772 RepID=UPI003FA1037C